MTPSDPSPPQALHWLLAAQPAWLDEGRERFGAPDFLWQMTLRRLGLQRADWLLGQPDTVRMALVVWRRWRRRWIVGEWRAA